MSRVLAGDVGGTKLHLGLFAGEEGAAGLSPMRLLAERRYPSRELGGLAPAVARFLDDNGLSAAGIDAACFGVAGPVRAGRSELPNLGWTLDAATLGSELEGPRVELVNDLMAAAEGIPALGPQDVVELAAGEPDPAGHRALIAPGTGLGMALVPRVGERWVALSSEGGHADFAPGCEEEVGLWRFLAARFGHVSLERVVSGPGLLHAYRFLADDGGGRGDAEVAREIVADDDPPAVIAAAGLAGRCPLCARAVGLFARAFGAAAGDLALTVLATGGLYLAGGIPPKLLDAERSALFLERFRAKGRFAGLAERMPVRLVLEQRLVLFGAARRAARTAAE